MKGKNYYHISALPGLPELGGTAPLTPQDLLAHLDGCPRARSLAEAVFLLDDLLLRESFLAGETQEVAPIVLTAEQVRNEAPLPSFLEAEANQQDDRRSVDALWERAFHHADELGRSAGSTFLPAWVAHEVGLRNALARARSRRLGLDETEYLVAPDLADSEEDFSGILTEWGSAATPLAGLRALVSGRWRWIAEHDAWFTFSDDELVAYAAKLMLVHQWRRLTEAEEQPGSVQA